MSASSERLEEEVEVVVGSVKDTEEDGEAIPCSADSKFLLLLRRVVVVVDVTTWLLIEDSLLLRKVKDVLGFLGIQR